jgi:ubiquinol-cytochrome c reductase cytochrome c subunit
VQAIIPTVLILTISGLAVTLIVVVIARSPYTHANFSPEGYDRTRIVYVGDQQPFEGMRLADPGAAHTGDAAQQGRLLFFQYGCAACHGLRGQGQAVGKEISDASALKLKEKVREGPKSMPQFPPSLLSDSDLEKLVAFLQSLNP